MAINILGDTPKQQWLNAIMIFETCIYENVRTVHEDAEFAFGCGADGYYKNLEIAMRTTKDFADEMRRLVEGTFGED